MDSSKLESGVLMNSGVSRECNFPFPSVYFIYGRSVPSARSLVQASASTGSRCRHCWLGPPASADGSAQVTRRAPAALGSELAIGCCRSLSSRSRSNVLPSGALLLRAFSASIATRAARCASDFWAAV